MFYHINQLALYTNNVFFHRHMKYLQVLKLFQENIHQKSSHFCKAIIAYVEKSLFWHIKTKNIYGEGETQKRLELNNVGPLISIKWKKSNKAILSPITDNLPKYNH